jgi:integrase/recombinase XerC
MDYFANYQQYLEGRGASRLTISGYLRDLRLFSTWFVKTNREQVSPENLTPIDIRLYRGHLIAEKMRPATINRRLAALRSFGSMLHETWDMPFNPAGGIRGVDKQKIAPKWLDKKQQTALIRALERQVMAARSEPARRQALRDRAAVILLLNSGLRVSELCALDLDDLELRERGGKLRVRSGKGDKAREIPLNKTARAAVKAWLELHLGEGQGPFLTGKRNIRLTPSGFERRLRLIGQMIGIEVNPHSLRHTFAKNLVDAGVSLEKVAALMGHENLNTTRIYTIPGEDDLEKAVDTLDF